MSSGSRRPNKSSGRSREPSSEGVPALQSFMSDTTVTTRDKHRNNFLRLLQNITGVEVDVSLSDGRVYRGVFYTATPFEGKKQEIALKGARKMDKSGRMVHDGNIDIGSTVLLLFSDIQTLTVTKSKISANQANKELDTDASLSRRTNIADLDGRNLESVSAAWLAPETSAKIDRGSMKSHVQGSWNQFEVNKRLYNVQDTFDENLYTKRLDKSSLTKEQQAKADRIANQIERSSTTNIHLKEERGQLVDTEGMDEEDLYSGVIRETPQQQQQGGGKGFGRGSSSPAGGGAWRKMDVSGMVSPSSKRQQGDSPSSGQSMASPALPPGLSQDDGDATATAATPPPTEKSDTVLAEEKSATDTADSSTSKTEDKKAEGDTVATQATPPKSTFSFNVSANEFVPSFAMKPPAAPTTPSTPPTNEGGGGRGGHHHSGGGRGGRGGRGRGGRGNNYGAGNNFAQQQQTMGFGPPMGGMPNMGFEMNPQMMYPQAPYGMQMGGMQMGGMPMGYDQNFQEGYYPGAGAYFGLGPGPAGMPYDPNFQGLPVVPMGYVEPAPSYVHNYVPSSAGGDMGGLPVAAGLGNIATSAPSGGEGGGGESGTPAASQKSEVGASDA